MNKKFQMQLHVRIQGFKCIYSAIKLRLRHSPDTVELMFFFGGGWRRIVSKKLLSVIHEAAIDY